MTEKALEYFESELKDKSDVKSPQRMCISYMHRDALDFLSTWLGVFKGTKVDSSTTRPKSDGKTNNAHIVTLATTTNFRRVNNSIRAFFGKFGFVSKTLYRSYELLHEMTAAIQGFLALTSKNGVRSNADEVAEGGYRYPRSTDPDRWDFEFRGRPTLILQDGKDPVDFGPLLSRSAKYRRRGKCGEALNDYLFEIYKNHGGDKENPSALLVSNMTYQERQRIYRLIKSVDSTVTLHYKVLRKEKSLLRKKQRAAREAPEVYAKAVATYLGAGGTQKAYRVCIKIARDCSKNPSGSLPSSSQTRSDCWKAIADSAHVDLKFRATPEGLAVNLRAAVELAVHLHETTPLPKPKVRKNASSRKTAPEPTVPAERFLETEQGTTEYVIKLTFDSRKVNSKRHHTEAAFNLMIGGYIGGLLSQLTMRIKTIVLWSGKDTQDLVERNLKETIVECEDLRQRGIVYDRDCNTFYGVRDTLGQEKYKIDWDAKPSVVLILCDDSDGACENVWRPDGRNRPVKIIFSFVLIWLLCSVSYSMVAGWTRMLLL